jgi:hypothetical protein
MIGSAAQHVNGLLVPISIRPSGVSLRNAIRQYRSQWQNQPPKNITRHNLDRPRKADIYFQTGRSQAIAIIIQKVRPTGVQISGRADVWRMDKELNCNVRTILP